MGEIIYFCYNGKMKRRYKGNMFEKIVQEIQDWLIPPAPVESLFCHRMAGVWKLYRDDSYAGCGFFEPYDSERKREDFVWLFIKYEERGYVHTKINESIDL